VAREEHGINYASSGNPDQTLDLYLPDTREFPTVLFLHGGSLQRGYDRSSEEYARVCEPFVASHVACATMDYRVAPQSKWPAMPTDVATAVRWIFDHVGAAGGDSRRIFLFGHSSGCQLAAAVATNPKYLEGGALSPASLAGVIAMGCILASLDQPIRRTQASGLGKDTLRARWDADPDNRFASFDDRLDSDPSRFIGPHVPPTLIVVAEQERFRPPILEQAAHFVDLMYRAERPADIVIVPGSHMSSIADLTQPDDPTFDAILRFIRDPTAAGAGSRPSSIRHQ